MTMEVKEVIGVIITVVLATAGVFGILLVLIIDKLGGVIDSLNSISASLRIIHNDTRDVVEVFEDGFMVEFEEPDELVSNEKNV